MLLVSAVKVVITSFAQGWQVFARRWKKTFFVEKPEWQE